MVNDPELAEMAQRRARRNRRISLVAIAALVLSTFGTGLVLFVNQFLAG